MIDYKQILIKYIEEVGSNEGIDFIPKHYDDTTFSNLELEALWECAGWNVKQQKYKIRG